jgi:hypothetical protein
VASSTERIRVKLPANFDPARHMDQVTKKIGELHGDGFEIDSLESTVHPDGTKGLVALGRGH